jgi:hypothetical protein
MNYDVPRKPGFYWVVWEDGKEPEPARFYIYVSGGKRFDGSEWGLYIKDWDMLGSDEGGDIPLRVLCRCELPGAPDV